MNTYMFKGVNSYYSLYADTNGTFRTAKSNINDPTQQWELIPIRGQSDTYQLKNRKTSSCLYNNADGRFNMSGCVAAYNDQWWKLIPICDDCTCEYWKKNRPSSYDKAKRCQKCCLYGTSGKSKHPPTDDFCKSKNPDISNVKSVKTPCVVGGCNRALGEQGWGDLCNAGDANYTCCGKSEPDVATSCKGWDCTIEGQKCPKGVPGASRSDYICKNRKWIPSCDDCTCHFWKNRNRPSSYEKANRCQKCCLTW